MTDTAFKATIFSQRENTVVMKVDQVDVDGNVTPMPWAGVDRMTLHLLSFNPQSLAPIAIVATADTADESTLIDYSVDGQLTFKLGDLMTTDSPPANVPAADYMIRVAAYAGGLDTQIVHEETHVARMKYVATD